jgi:hypothetical protein
MKKRKGKEKKILKNKYLQNEVIDRVVNMTKSCKMTSS